MKKYSCYHRFIREHYIQIRRYNSYNSVRVRFAPSPTGFLHLGGLRTALYNYLFAKKQNGTFILRIEDTDQTRLVPDAVNKLEDDLQWAGLNPDEGPSAGGPYGPYFQSERLSLYRDKVKNLLENGSAYYCFCTELRLELLRKDAMRRQEVPKYDNKCRHLTKEEVEKKLESKTNYCVRFKLTDYPEPFEDMIYGPIVNNIVEIEGDPVIMKKDGYPTYHFANVVDDHCMEISHVLRGVEWQTSTTKHLLLYKAFNWKPPKFGHLPLLLNEDGTKLSKRQQNITVESYRDGGIFPLALLNFVISCGGYMKKQVITYQTLEELIENFDLNRVNVKSCHVNYELLPQFNRLLLKKSIENPETLDNMVQTLKRLVQSTYFNRLDVKLKLDDEHVRNIIIWGSQDRISNVNDLVGPQFSFLWCKPCLENLRCYDNLFYEKLEVLIEKLENEEFSLAGTSKLLKEFCAENGVKFGQYMMFLRKIVSGLKEGPGISEMFNVLGKAEIISRLREIVLAYKNNEIKMQVQ